MPKRPKSAFDLTPAEALQAIPLTLREIAARAGISESALKRYRAGTRTPPRDVCLKLSVALIQEGDAVCDAAVALSLYGTGLRDETLAVLERLRAQPQEIATLREELGRAGAINALLRDLVHNPPRGDDA